MNDRSRMLSVKRRVAPIFLLAMAALAAASFSQFAAPHPRTSAHSGVLWHFNTHG